MRGGDVGTPAEAESDSEDGFEQVLITRGAGLRGTMTSRGNDCAMRFSICVGEGVDLARGSQCGRR